MKKTIFLIGFIMFSFLKNADSQTTVVLQPGPESKDAQLWTIMPNNNYGNSPKFVCSGWTHYGEPGVNRSLIDFDLSVIPENAVITDAKLSFYFVCLEPTYFGHTGNNEAYLQLITETWEEDSVTWNTQPMTTEADQLYLPPSTDPYQDYTDIDVTALIGKLYAEPDDYHGLMLKLLNEYPYNCLLFASSDYNDTIEFRPKLEITYIEAPTTIVIQPGAEGKDAQLWSIMPDNNYGNTPKFVCMGWTHYGVPGVNRALIDFDLSSVPENVQIIDARLSFCFVNLEPTYFGHTGENEAYLQLVTEPWEEDYVTWNEQPMTTEDCQVFLPPSTDPYQDYTGIDVTALIGKLYAEPGDYHGLMLKLLNEYPYNCLLFASSDYNDTIEFRPKLEITYIEAPTTIVIQPGAEGKDAQLWSIMPNNNYGNIPKFDCSGWTHYGEPGINRGIIDFDLSSIPEGAEILDARLNLYFVCLEPTFFGHTGENEAYLQLITEPWEEEYVTWNEQPMTTEEDQVFLPRSTDPYQDYTDIDVTIPIRKLFNDPDNYHGLMLKLINEYPYTCLLFASSDYMDTAGFRPRLEITYTNYQMLPVAGFTYITEGLNVFFENSSINADDYFWDFGDGYYSDLTNPWHTYTVAGDYSVCLMTWNKNGSDSVCQIISSLTAAISENYPPSFLIYPNPASDQFTISTNLNDRAELTIFDLSGHILINSMADFASAECVKIGVNHLPAGIYFARITSGSITETSKIIISH
ncbi:MAG: DNRLRE domain-containing protein [Bacteroidales bacterium]|nr:DNRLRE domain-containing protein [Bacteroidales bacterium]